MYFDRTLNPSKNLEREADLFRRVDRGDLPELARFWRNSECLVRGKAKSRRYGWYHEDAARRMRIRVIQRETGGGVVYHDGGNLNWSLFARTAGPFHSPARIFGEASQYMVKALESLGVEARFSSPNRIDVEGRKVSGLAARATPRALLVHGTLLLSSDLEKLNALCIPPEGCPPVANVREWVAGVDPRQVVEAFEGVLKSTGVLVLHQRWDERSQEGQTFRSGQARRASS